MASRRKREREQRPLETDVVHIFTDGSAYAKTRDGGWGCVLIFINGADQKEYRREASGGDINTTNNRMELTAILEGLRLLKRDPLYRVVVYTDSRYCVDTLSARVHKWRANGWQKPGGGDVPNHDLLEQIVLAQPGKCVFKWLKGHVGHAWNERADELAGAGRKSAELHREKIFKEMADAAKSSVRTRTRPTADNGNASSQDKPPGDDQPG